MWLLRRGAPLDEASPSRGYRLLAEAPPPRPRRRPRESAPWAEPDDAPDVEPFRFPLLGAPGYTTVREHVVAPSSVHAAAENALDVPHTAFLHAGLFFELAALLRARR